MVRSSKLPLPLESQFERGRAASHACSCRLTPGNCYVLALGYGARTQRPACPREVDTDDASSTACAGRAPAEPSPEVLEEPAADRLRGRLGRAAEAALPSATAATLHPPFTSRAWTCCCIVRALRKWLPHHCVPRWGSPLSKSVGLV